jgi:hypothetical protein
MKHTREDQRRVVLVTMLIDVDTWNEAVWQGMLYMGWPSGHDLPVLGLFFGTEDAGQKIFCDWCTRLGNKDTKEEIRVAIIEGDVPGFLPGYFVHIGPNLDRVVERAQEGGHSDPRFIGLLSRIKRIDCPKSPHLLNFKREFRKHGKYRLAPAFLSSGQPKAELTLAIEKSKIHFRTAAEVGPKDIDRACFLHDPGEVDRN